MKTPVRLVPISPYDGKTGLLLPFVLERIRHMAVERASELDSNQVVVNIGGRVYGGDPSIALLAFLDDKTQLIGHAVATIETDGTNTWVFISQVAMDAGDWSNADGSEGSPVVLALEVADRWAQGYSERILVPRGMKPIQKMLMATHREERGWIKKYGFEPHRHVMIRDVGQQEKGEGS